MREGQLLFLGCWGWVFVALHTCGSAQQCSKIRHHCGTEVTHAHPLTAHRVSAQTHIHAQPFSMLLTCTDVAEEKRRFNSKVNTLAEISCCCMCLGKPGKLVLLDPLSILIRVPGKHSQMFASNFHTMPSLCYIAMQAESADLQTADVQTCKNSGVKPHQAGLVILTNTGCMHLQ